MKRFVLLALGAWLLAMAAPSPRAQDKPGATEAKAVDYLIIAADGLQEAAREWATHRQSHGRVTQVATLSEIARLAEREKVNLLDIKKFIKGVGGETPREGFQVLLLGDCPVVGRESYDPQVEIPWFMSTYMDAFGRSAIPGDNWLADAVSGDNEIPDLAVGRVPARSLEQARLALKKVKAYESAKMGEWMRRLTFFAGEGRFGAAVDQLLENLFTQMAEQVIDPAYDLRMTYANVKSPYAYVPARFSDKVIEEANAGSLLLSYMGHGAVDRLDDMHVPQGEGKRELRYPILTEADVSKFKIENGQLPVMIIVACATGFLDDKDGCISERILFEEKAPVAVISSSRDSHPYSNTLLQNALISEITKQRRGTLGEAFLRAKREIVLGEDSNRLKLENMAAFIIPKKEERDTLNRAHLYLYNLIGDPGLRLRYPNVKVGLPDKLAPMAAGESCTIDVSFEPVVPGAAAAGSGEASKPRLLATLEVRRSRVHGDLVAFEAKDLAGSDAARRKEAEDAVSKNHATANQKVVSELPWESLGFGAAGLAGGKLTIKADSGLAPGDYVVKLFALDSKGQSCGFASLRLRIKKKE
ncbi:MAG: hypothetical protein HUU03_11780 [Planctomycetaceae bacterium]|nr:hypothetical protein [Planctomycetaceae bacterium]